MNSSYKIALIASVVVCVVVIGFYTAQRRVSPVQAGAEASQNEIDGNTPVSGDATSSSGTSSGTDRTSSSSRASHSDTSGSPISRTIVPLGPGSQSGRSGSGSSGSGGSGTSSYDAPQDRTSRTISSGTSGSVGSGSGSAAAPSPAPAPSPALVPAGQPYVIKPGDNFHALAKRLYGSDKHWVDIAQANPSIDPIRLKVGQTIRLPAIANATPTGSGAGSGKSSGVLGAAGAAGVPGAPAPKSLTHIVKPGETLASISKRYYKTTDKWEMLFRLNRETVGADPDDLEAGMKLTIPPAD